ncbi:CLUMA_CG015262, isoform A [Clunio marinus]|uniref:CLUMA_CG015262, isoform A n=1 Tax=Clunio marinus TaxID=568069 RepID=A0A1J1INR6_9DIPT|nr:CLUMA_CG015262, isoform A [Clunio marinus]
MVKLLIILAVICLVGIVLFLNVHQILALAEPHGRRGGWSRGESFNNNNNNGFDPANIIQQILTLLNNLRTALGL